MNRTKLLTGVTLAVMLAGALAFGPKIMREGDDAHIAKMAQLEGKPLADDAWSGIDEWIGGSKLDAGNLKNKVTVLATFEATNRKSMSIISTLKRVQRKNEGNDLSIALIHGADGWDTVGEMVESGKIPFAVGRDAEGKFAEALGVDAHPDVFVFDKAGNLRYADIKTSGIARSIMTLSKETAEEAAEAAAALTKKAEKTASKADDAGSDDTGTDQQAKPERIDPKTLVPAMIPPKYYDKADWPEHNQLSGATNMQGKKMPEWLANETWITETEQDPDNFVVVFDFWATWCGPCKRAIPTLDKLQRQHKFDLMVLGMGGQGEDERTIRKFLRGKNESYFHLFDKKQTMYRVFSPRGIPHVAVISTDRVVRWQGNPLEEGFRGAVKQIVKNDPYIRARKSRLRIPADELLERPEPQGPWPEHNAKDTLNAKNDLQGTTPEAPLGDLEWLNTDEAPDTDNKLVIIDFWATWCGPCRKFSPALDKIQEKFKDDVAVVAISEDDKKETVEEYLKGHPVSYTHAYPVAGKTKWSDEIGVEGIPHLLIISSDGVVRWQGFHGTVGDFEEFIEQLVEADRAIRD